MYLNSIRLKNFNNFSEREFQFSKINLITGSNGAGKTSLLEAIIGSFIDYWEYKLETYIKRGQKKFEIESDFYFFNEKFNYLIEYEKGTKRRLIYNGDAIHPYVGSDCITKLRDYINPDIALFSNISTQGNSIQILKEKPTARLEKFKQLFNIKKVDESVDRIQNDIELLRVEIKEKESFVNNLKSQKFNYQDVPEKIDLSSLEIQIKNLEVQKLEYEKKVKEYEVYKKQLQEYKDYIDIKSRSENSIQLLNAQLQDLSKKLPLINLEDLTIKIEEIKNEKNKLEQQKKQYDINTEKETKYKKELEKYEKEISDLKFKRLQPLSFTEEHYSECFKSLQSVKEEFVLKNNKYKAIQNGKCPECGAEYDTSEIKEYEKLIISLEKDLNYYKQLIDNYDNEKKDYEKGNQENQFLKQRKELLSKLVENINQPLKEIAEFNSIFNYENSIELIKNDEKNLIEYNSQLKQIQEIQKLKVDVEKEVIKFQTTLSNLIEKENPIEIIDPGEFNYFELGELQKRLNIAQEREKEIERIVQFNEGVKQQEKQNIKDIVENEDILSKKRYRLTLLESARKVLGKNFVAYLIDQGTNFVKDRMNDLFQRSYDKNYVVSLQKDNSGADFYYTDNTNILSPIGKASGYEKQLLSITFRFALASLHKLGLFILDEIDSDSDEENSLKLYKTILNQKFGQIFCVTHKEPTKEYLMNLNECQLIEL